MPEPELSVSEDQIRSFRENGYLVLDRITTDAELEELRGIYDRIFAERLGEEEGKYFDLAGKRGHDGEDVLPQVLEPESKLPELRETVYQRNAKRVGAALLGARADEVFPYGHMIMKPARIGRETPWHQDEAYWDPKLSYRGLSVWMPLEDATVESGCMWFAPGTHLERVRVHKHIDDDPSVHGLMLDDAGAPDGAVACPIPAGGATIHHCRILHYAGPNTTDRPRRAYITIVNAPPSKAETPAVRPWLDEERETLAGGSGG